MEVINSNGRHNKKLSEDVSAKHTKKHALIATSLRFTKKRKKFHHSINKT